MMWHSLADERISVRDLFRLIDRALPPPPLQHVQQYPQGSGPRCIRKFERSARALPRRERIDGTDTDLSRSDDFHD
jgi:hypothetical protein